MYDHLSDHRTAGTHHDHLAGARTEHHLSTQVCTGRYTKQAPLSTSSNSLIRPILWGHSGPLCHALSLLLLWTSILHCHSPGVATVARRLRYSYSWLRLILVVVSTVETPGEWQCKIRTGGVRRLAVANGLNNIFQMLLVFPATCSSDKHEQMTLMITLRFSDN